MFMIATKTMANELTTHQQRKPPDVEEALSSMLWTPYECNGTETSSDDDVADDYNQLQHHNQLYDYDKYPHNYIAVVPITSLRATSNANSATACYFAEDSVGQPSSLANDVATPLVPFPLTVANCSNETNLLPTAARLHYRESKNYHKVSTINALSDVTYEQATNITASANVNRTKRSYYPRYAALNKWWPASSSYRGAPTTLPTFTATPTLTTTTTGVERKPPSYESLYAIKPHSKRHHLQLLKPVLNTWNRLANINTNKNNNNSNPDIFEYNIAQQEQEQDEEQQQLDNNYVRRSTNNQHFAEESFAANFVNEDCNVETNVASTNVDNQPIINLNNRQQQQQQIHSGLYGQHCEMPPTITTAHKQEKLKLMSHTQQQPAANNTRSPQQTQENLAKFVKGNPLITKATTIKDLNDQQQQQQQQQRVVEYGTDTEQVTQLQMNVFSLVEKETNSPPIKSKRDHSRKRTNQQANEYKSLFYYRNETFVESISTSCLLELDGNKADCTSERGTDTALNGKPNNKCLAELERLYAEFQASEQLREQQLKLNEMRLNVPARGGDDVMTAPKFNSNSCVILTDTNSVTALMKPSQLSPSLTIQVNQNNNNNNNNHNDNVIQNNNNNNNNSNASKFSESAATTVNYKSLQNQSHDDDVAKCKNSGEAIINNAKTTTATSGICVVNCNYVNSKNSNNVNNNINNNKNNNNNNYSLNDNINNSDHNRVTTNLTIEKTQQQQQQLHNTNVFMIDSYKKQNNNNLNQIQNSINNDYNNAATVSNITVDAMPNLISDINIIINCENDHNEYKNNDNERDQVNVIQVNETTTTTATPTKITAKRTFTSTECQTDDISSVQLRMPSSQVVEATSVIEATPTYMNNRDQRRHRRRERRFLHYTNSLINPVLSFNHAMLRHRPPPPPHPTHPHFQTHPHHTHLMERHSMPVNHVTALLHPAPVPPPPPPPPAALLRSMLPDILHNHFPPPYSALSLAIGNDSGHILESSGPTPTPTPITPPPPSLLPTIQQPALVPSATATTVLSAAPVLPASAITTVSNNNNLLTSVISTVPLPNATQLLHDGRFSFPLPVMRRSPSERSGKGCCGQWFAGPPLRALIAVVALGGLACALSGAALGATGLAGPPSSHLTAALLMIGVGVVLVTVSGAAWRMTAPGGPPCLGLGSSVDLGACSRRPCSRGGGAPPGLLYPEFQHRPPPPSYQASMQEYRLRLLLLDRDRQSGVVRGNSPPPTYRSHAGSLSRAPLTTTQRGGGGCGGGSSVAGSEYSFPPSYRSRNNTTPGTVNSRRSIETEPSGRLLANEDLSEPLSVEQLSEYDSLQQTRLSSRLQSTTAATTAALHKSNNMVNNKKDFNGNVEEKSSRKGMFKLAKDTISVEENPDRITIVTITAENRNGDDNDTLTTTTSSAAITNRSSNGSSSNTSNNNNPNMQQQAERIEILAHL